MQLLGSAQHNVSPQGGNRFSKWLGRTVLAAMGWQVAGQFPSREKYIITLAPHTSNWDFVVGVAILLASGLKISFLIKHSLFFWPFKLFLLNVGGIPVDRRAAQGIVGQMVDHFNNNDKLVLAITPEGTRRKVKEWKVGFLHIGNKAKVPVLPISLDYFDKVAKIGDPIELTGTIEADLNTVKAYYYGARGKNTKNA
jgi:1-acyl-sn-glycerol-3-phosphate acyltransferase